MSWENILKKNCGCGKDPCKTYGMVVEVKKGKGERHFFEDGKQYIGDTHKHPDGTLMSGSKHVEGESKKLYHFNELSQKALKHLSKETTVIKQKIDAGSMKEMMKNLNVLIEGIDVTRRALHNTPKTEDNQYDHDAIRELLLQIEINLSKLSTDLGTLSEVDDFDFNIPSERIE
jgi:hypothetical protein